MKSLPAVLPSGFAAADLELSAGVYMLYRGERVVYVGQGGNVFARIGTHRRSFEFDFATWMPIASKRDRYAYEAALVRRFNPSLTTRCSSDEERDLEILARLGLDPDPGARLAFLHRLKRHSESRGRTARRMWKGKGFRERWQRGRALAGQRRAGAAA